MRIPFTKMQGAGNDFVVLNETQNPLALSPAQYRFLADRHFGIGADQILSVRPAPAHAASDIDFAYAIHNSDGTEVEHCGNGARCFARFVQELGLTTKNRIKVQTQNRVLELLIDAQGQVRVDMQEPRFEHADLPFNASGLVPQTVGNWQLWPLDLTELAGQTSDLSTPENLVFIAPVSMGNPHAVQLVNDVNTAPVLTVGAQVESHWRFAHRVNAGFMQIVSRQHVKLRVYERGAGETWACGTGACAAVATGIRLGLLDATKPIQVDMRGGTLSVEWAGLGQALFLSGPATIVYHGEIDIPSHSSS